MANIYHYFWAFRKILWLCLLYVFCIVLSTIRSFYRLFYLYTLPKCIELIMRWALHPNHHRKMQKKINEKRKSACFVRIIKYVLIANKYFTYSYIVIQEDTHIVVHLHMECALIIYAYSNYNCIQFIHFNRLYLRC